VKTRALALPLVLDLREHELTPSMKRKVLRLAPDPRPCPAGEDLTLDRCHECGSRSREDVSGRV